jgi:ligand-binding sensor domain-containing protein
MWFGTGRGLAKFDGSKWTIFNTSNSGLPSNSVQAVAIDDSGNKWIGTSNGLAKFNGSEWTVFNTANSGLPSNYIMSITIDNMYGSIWVRTSSPDVAIFDGSDWGIFYTYVNCVYSIVVDKNGNKWIGTSNGLIKLDDVSHMEYRFYAYDSPLPSDVIYSLAVDDSGNVWIGTLEGGLSVYQAGKVSVEETKIPKDFSRPSNFVLYQNYPNPFNPITTITYSLPYGADVSLNVYNINGQMILSLVNERQNAGYYSVRLDGSKLSSGIYFYQLKAENFVQTKKMIIMK